MIPIPIKLSIFSEIVFKIQTANINQLKIARPYLKYLFQKDHDRRVLIINRVHNDAKRMSNAAIEVFFRRLALLENLVRKLLDIFIQIV